MDTSRGPTGGEVDRSMRSDVEPFRASDVVTEHAQLDHSNGFAPRLPLIGVRFGIAAGSARVR
jgi:hypothetical protein